MLLKSLGIQKSNIKFFDKFFIRIVPFDFVALSYSNDRSV